MKNKIYFTTIFTLVICMIFPLLVKSQNMILAGQTEGEYIHYTDYEPDSIVELINPYDYFDLDLNHDGVSDLGFWIEGQFVFQQYYRFEAKAKIYNDQVELARQSQSSLAENLCLSDTIDDSLFWTGDTLSASILRGYYFSFIPPPGNGSSYGEFGSGYLGFRIIYSWETYYGWIDINAYISSSGAGSSITAKSSAFYSQTVGLENLAEISNNLKIFPNPCRERVTIEMPGQDPGVHTFGIFNTMGEMVMSGKIDGSQADIDVSELSPGIYVVEVDKGSGRLNHTKFIKQ